MIELLTPLFAVGLVVGPLSVGLADALLGAHDLPARAARVDRPVAQVPPRLVHLAVHRVQQVLALIVWGIRLQMYVKIEYMSENMTLMASRIALMPN